MIEILFTLSILTNIFLVWYIVQLLRRFLVFQEELDDFAEKLEEYEGHVEIINNLERFYGDETISNLLRHSKAVVKECKDFQNILSNEEEEYAEEEES
jgi:hypothetical protein